MVCGGWKVHGPLQVPDAYFARFESFVDNPQRAKYHSMVNWIDGAVGRVVHSLKNAGIYNETLICMNSDNGGPLPSGNNYPLKGGKFSNWEGTRTPTRIIAHRNSSPNVIFMIC